MFDKHFIFLTHWFSRKLCPSPIGFEPDIVVPAQYRAVSFVTDIHKLMIWWRKYNSSNTLLRVIKKTPQEASNAKKAILQKRTHVFFIAPYAEYPLIIGFSLFGILEATVHYFHGGHASGFFTDFSIILFIGGITYWAFEIEKMVLYASIYSRVVRRNMVSGVILFIISEVMVFFGLFWAFFHSSLNPAVELGAVWPPQKLSVLDWGKWPLLSTTLLVYSGFGANLSFFSLKVTNMRRIFFHLQQVLLIPITWIKEGRALFAETVEKASNYFELSPPSNILTKLNSLQSLPECETDCATLSNGDKALFERIQFWTDVRHELWTRFRSIWCTLHNMYGGVLFSLFAGGLFVVCQNHEYKHAYFSMADGVYGSIFYSLTGLHGIHVFAGLILLFLTLARFLNRIFDASSHPHTGVSSSVWYWHFVDVVWVLLFVLLYFWGNSKGDEFPFNLFPIKMNPVNFNN